MIEASPGLAQEIGEIYRSYTYNEELTPKILLGVLNTPALIQRRGFEITAEHLLAEVLGLWSIDGRTRWVLYDFDQGHVIGGPVFALKAEAQEALDTFRQADDLIPVRFQAP